MVQVGGQVVRAEEEGREMRYTSKDVLAISFVFAGAITSTILFIIGIVRKESLYMNAMAGVAVFILWGMLWVEWRKGQRK